MSNTNPQERKLTIDEAVQWLFEKNAIEKDNDDLTTLTAVLIIASKVMRLPSGDCSHYFINDNGFWQAEYEIDRPTIKLSQIESTQSNTVEREEGKVKVICSHCHKEKEGVVTGLCNHCGRFGKLSPLKSIKGKATSVESSEKEPKVEKLYFTRLKNNPDLIKEIRVIADKLLTLDGDCKSHLADVGCFLNFLSGDLGKMSEKAFELHQVQIHTPPTNESQTNTSLPKESIKGGANCLDCNKPYSTFGLDVILPREQWLQIHPDENGLLCAQCIVNRAEKIKDVVCLNASMSFVSDRQNSIKGEDVEEAALSKHIEFMHNNNVHEEDIKLWVKGFKHGRQQSESRIKELEEALKAIEFLSEDDLSRDTAKKALAKKN